MARDEHSESMSSTLDMLDTYSVRLFDAVELYERHRTLLNIGTLIGTISILSGLFTTAAIFTGYDSSASASNFLDKNSVSVPIAVGIVFVISTSIVSTIYLNYIQRRRAIVFKIRVTSNALDNLLSAATAAMEMDGRPVSVLENTLWAIKIGQARLALQSAEYILRRAQANPSI